MLGQVRLQTRESSCFASSTSPLSSLIRIGNLQMLFLLLPPMHPPLMFLCPANVYIDWQPVCSHYDAVARLVARSLSLSLTVGVPREGREQINTHTHTHRCRWERGARIAFSRINSSCSAIRLSDCRTSCARVAGELQPSFHVCVPCPDGRLRLKDFPTETRLHHHSPLMAVRSVNSNLRSCLRFRNCPGMARCWREETSQYCCRETSNSVSAESRKLLACPSPSPPPPPPPPAAAADDNPARVSSHTLLQQFSRET